MNEITKAYVAGLFDGEGCVYTRCIETGKKQHSDVKIQLGSTNEDIILWLHGLFGGTLYTRPSHQNNKAFHMWHLNEKDRLMIFFEAIEPYLRLKRGQVSAAMMFMQTCRGSGNRLDKNDKMLRSMMIREIRRLNQRGVNAA